MPRAFRALQRTSIACMASLGHIKIGLQGSKSAKSIPAVAAAFYSTKQPPAHAVKKQEIVMAGPWSGVRKAIVRTVTSRPFVAALGVTAVGVWVAHEQLWPGRRQLHSASTTGPVHRSVQANMGNDSAATSSNPFSPVVPLILTSGAAMIPHPDKLEKGGEDAFFICKTGSCVGVADGVGGWAEIGVDPGLYSRELMKHAAEACIEVPAGPDRPQLALDLAHKRTVARGSSTACILCIHKGALHASNLGDSGFMVVRGGELAFMSPQQQHEFNFPYQIGSADSMADMPSAAQRFAIEVSPGDIVVLATDGVFDNVYPDEAAALVSLARRRGVGAEAAAVTLAEFARTRAADPAHLSPFAYAAQQLGFRYFGGKMDDITVVCAYVEEEEEDVPGRGGPSAGHVSSKEDGAPKGSKL